MTFSSGLTITREKRILSGQIAAIGFAFYIILMLIETFFRISAWVGLPFHCLFFFTFFIAGCNFRKRESEDLLTDRRNEVGLEVGEFVHTLGDAHIYLNHMEQVKTQLAREEMALPTLVLKHPEKSMFDIDVTDVVVEGYQSHPTIKAPIAV